MKMLSPDEIKELRQKLGMTAVQFADRLGVHIDTVFRWERGSRHPTYQRMIDLNELLKDAEPTAPAHPQ